MQQRRIGKYRPQFDQTVLVNDSQFDSRYFRLDDVPEILTAGKNMFKMFGNNQLLQADTQVLIQVTDINNNPVYHHVNNYIDSTGRLLIGIWIYPETPPGIGKIEILGIAAFRSDGRRIPQNWRNRYNIKWSRDIIIQPSDINKTPIIFKKIPGVKLTENIREYLTQTYVSGTSIATSTDGSLTYSYNGYGDAYISKTGGIFSASMAGGLITIPDPGFSLPTGYSLQPGEDIIYSAYVDAVLSSTTIKVSPYSLAVKSEQTSGNQGGGGTGRTKLSISTVNSILPVSAFGPVTGYTLEFQQEATYATGSINSQSFASITLKNLEPIAGNIHSIKTHMKSHGFAGWELISEEILQERNLLIDVQSDLAFDPIGDFKNQPTINNFWASSSVNQPGNAFINKHDDSEMISSMVITGSVELSGSTNYPDAPLASDPYIKVYSIPDVEIYQDNEYQIKFKVVALANSSNQISSSYMDVYISGSNIGASDDRNIGFKLVTLETENKAAPRVNDVSNFKNIPDNSAGTTTTVNTTYFPTFTVDRSIDVAANWSPNTTVNTSVTDTAGPDRRLLELSYTPSLDTDAHLVFAVTRGKWHIANIQMEGANDYGFTPNHTFLEIPIQTPQSDDVLDFKFEFYNAAGDIANISLTTQSMDFVGGNLYVSGDQNQVSGSFIIGNGLIMRGFA